ncbi:hypothetical protein Rsub_09484 [Raphidocelis subcapitata]|uniref:ARID domain-containing protein n=1 Tax=Raphidocelis subcapitata TaxID=307507 RepID=A0A2V0PCR7_9CHLO|nr:hypothetical protein Rsub_09484 [Raphidocelis subcapitata]|eukprot:GBF96742.1 hypothetical protein Rsub_09484 [Raphidocelis subcapitata]
MAATPHQAAAPAAPGEHESSISVVCGAARGLMLLPRQRVLMPAAQAGGGGGSGGAGAGGAAVVSPTEFERLGGRGSYKHWRTSIRVAEDGCAIGEWLAARGVASPRPSQQGDGAAAAESSTGASGDSSSEVADVPVSPPGAAASHPSAAASPPGPAASPPDPAAASSSAPPRRPPPPRPAGDALLRTLAEAAAASLSASTPPPPPPPRSGAPPPAADAAVLQVLLAHRAAQQRAEAEKRAASRALFGAAGLPLAKRRRVTRLPGDGDPRVAAMAAYLAGTTQQLPPRHLLPPAAVNPAVAGRAVDLRALFRAVVGRGGHLRVSLTSQWGAVLQQLNLAGAPGAEVATQALYENVLLRFERIYDPDMWLAATGLPSPIALDTALRLRAGSAASV